MSRMFYCELCATPHLRGVVRCSRCHHFVGTRPEWPRLEKEVGELRWRIAAGVLLVLLMIGSSLL